MNKKVKKEKRKAKRLAKQLEFRAEQQKLKEADKPFRKISYTKPPELVIQTKDEARKARNKRKARSKLNNAPSIKLRGRTLRRFNVSLEKKLKGLNKHLSEINTKLSKTEPAIEEFYRTTYNPDTISSLKNLRHMIAVLKLEQSFLASDRKAHKPHSYKTYENGSFIFKLFPGNPEKLKEVNNHKKYIDLVIAKHYSQKRISETSRSLQEAQNQLSV